MAHFSTQQEITPERWDAKANWSMGQTSEEKTINIILDEIRAGLHMYYYDCQASGESVSALKLKNKLCSTEEKPIKSTIVDCLYLAAEKYLPGQKIRTDYSDGDPDFESAFYVLKHTLCPAVLTENLFMDNKEDCRFLLSSKGRQAIINLHIEGLIEYMDDEESKGLGRHLSTNPYSSFCPAQSGHSYITPFHSLTL